MKIQYDLFDSTKNNVLLNVDEKKVLTAANKMQQWNGWSLSKCIRVISREYASGKTIDEIIEAYN